MQAWIAREPGCCGRRRRPAAEGESEVPGDGGCARFSEREAEPAWGTKEPGRSSCTCPHAPAHRAGGVNPSTTRPPLPVLSPRTVSAQAGKPVRSLSARDVPLTAQAGYTPPLPVRLHPTKPVRRRTQYRRSPGIPLALRLSARTRPLRGRVHPHAAREPPPRTPEACIPSPRPIPTRPRIYSPPHAQLHRARPRRAR